MTRARAELPDRAARFYASALLLGFYQAEAYDIADLALDVQASSDPRRDLVLALAQASFDGEDDYDEFRRELIDEAGL